MFAENTFKTAVILSLIIHTAILLSIPRFYSAKARKSLERIEITYTKISTLTAALKARAAQIKPPPMANPLKDNIGLLSKDRLPAVPMDSTQMSDYFKKADLMDRKPLSAKQFMTQKRISLPAIKSEKMKNPVYNNYYQIVREKIRHRAYTNYDKYETGEVYLTFVVTSDGRLKGVKLIEEKTRAANYLQDIALKSINDAAPFPAFPKNLQFPELSFNVVISFEVNN